jgi:uncharacterized protein (UPF0332 family)
MSFNWSELLDVAEFIAAQKPTGSIGEQALARSTVNRAYYAAYWKARSFWEDKGQSIDRSRAHSHVIELFRHSGATDLEMIGDDLDYLHADRIRADYLKEAIVSTEKAEESLEIASDIIAKVKAL